MNTISSVFKRSGHKALIAYITMGYPTINATLEAVPLLAQNGCDIVELGIPFSDPLADGVTIQNASYCALQNGITPGLCLDIAAKLSKKVNIPLVFMTYFNPVFNYGLEAFCQKSIQSGISGLIIPDLTPDEGTHLETITQNTGLDLIYLLSPSSNQQRIKLVAQKSRGFIYLVSVTGITGARNSLSPELGAFVARVRKTTARPLCIGFGISTPEQAGHIAQLANGVIVGSRILQLMESDRSLNSVANFIRELREAIDSIS
jgi:tryptophan synthase alpha chain